MKTAITLIIEERHKQVAKHGYDINHDLEHDNEELVQAAIAYLLPNVATSECPTNWPFDASEWHGDDDDRITQLVKAASLLVAQINTEIYRSLNNTQQEFDDERNFI